MTDPLDRPAGAELLRTLVETAGSPIVCLDDRSLVSVFNPAAERVFGRRREDVVGRPYADLLPEQVRAKVTADLARVFAGEPIAQFENVIRRPDGEYSVLLWNITRLTSPPDRPVGIVAVGQDITVLQRMQERLIRQTRHLLGLSRVDRAILSLQPPEAIADAGLTHLSQLGPFEGAAVIFFDRQARRAIRVAVDGQLRTMPPESRPLEPADDVDPPLPTGPGAPLEVPLVANGARVGTLVIRCIGDVQALSLTALEFIGQTADRLALGLDNARLFEAERQARRQFQAASARLVEIQETERRRIARELHDDVGQALTGLKIHLEMQGGRPRNREAGLRHAISMVHSLIARVRNFSLDLRPTLLDDLGLVPALLSLAERYSQQTGVEVHIEHRVGMRRFDPDIETTAFRIIQEALTNVARHAGAGRATVRVNLDGSTLAIVVEDKGRGFDRSDRGAESSGLSSMQERAAMVGGRVTVRSQPGAGTTVRATLPVEGTRRRAAPAGGRSVGRP